MGCIRWRTLLVCSVHHPPPCNKLQTFPAAGGPAALHSSGRRLTHAALTSSQAYVLDLTHLLPLCWQLHSLHAVHHPPHRS